MTDQLFKRTNLAGYGIRLMFAAAMAVSASCSDLATTGTSPTYLIMDNMTASGGTTPLLSDVLADTLVINDVGTAQIRAELKNSLTSTTPQGTTIFAPTGPTPANSVTLSRYRVTFRRADGRNTPGVDVPYGFDGVVSRTITVAGQAQSVNFDLVRHQNKEEPPLRSLRGLGGLAVITTIAEVTFYGRDQAGHEVSVTGFIDVQFGDF